MIPVTNATSERTFSTLRCIMTYLRSTMAQEKQTNLMILRIHQEAKENLDISAIGNNFVAVSER